MIVKELKDEIIARDNCIKVMSWRIDYVNRILEGDFGIIAKPENTASGIKANYLKVKVTNEALRT